MKMMQVPSSHGLYTGFIKRQGKVLGHAGSPPESILIPTYDKKLLEGRCESTRGSMSRSLTFTGWMFVDSR